MNDFRNKTTELTKASDLSNYGWAQVQQKRNVVNGVNNTIKTYVDAANKDGMAFAASDVSDPSMVLGFLTARQNIEGFGNPVLGPEKTQALLKNFNQDYIKSFVAGVAETSPVKAAQLLEQDSIKQNFTTQERGDLADLIKRTKRQQELTKSLQVTYNNGDLMEVVNDPQLTYFEKRAAIDRMDMIGNITPKAAEQARRVIKSSNDLDAQTDTPVMADIINQVYDLNATSQTNAGDYLHGVQNIQHQILEMQAAGKLTAQDATKLSHQLTTLTNKRVSDATQQVGNVFYEANQKFNALPPQYRGEATRQLFYATDGQNLSKQQLNTTALGILDTIQTQRRKEALQTATDAARSDSLFLKTTPYSAADVSETARKYGITEQQVIQQMRAKRAAKHMVGKPTRMAPQVEDDQTTQPSPGIQIDSNAPDVNDEGDYQ